MLAIPPGALFSGILARASPDDVTRALYTTGTAPVHLEVSLNGTVVITVDDGSPTRLAGGVPGIENYDAGVTYDRFDVLAR